METAMFSPCSLFGETSDNNSSDGENNDDTHQNFVQRTHQFPQMELIIREFSFHQLNANLLWPGTFAFVDWLVQHRSWIEGRHVIELGSGTGALAVFLNKLFQIDITTSDYDDQEIEQNIAYNCRVNGVVPVLPHVKHTWGEPFLNSTSNWDLIIASDILLYVKQYPNLIKTLSFLLNAYQPNNSLNTPVQNEHDSGLPRPAFLMSWRRRIGKDDESLFFNGCQAAGLELMIPAFRESVVEMLEVWDKRIPENGSAEIDIWPQLSSVTGDIISRAAFGSVYGDGRRIFELLSLQKELVLSQLKFSYIPGYSYLPTEGNKKMKEVNNEIQSLLENVIQKRKKAMEAGEATKDDLLGLLMESNYRESQLERGGRKKQLIMSFQDLIDECKLFFLAGHESSAVLLLWTMVLLSKHQDWQTRAREEVLATFGMDEPTDYDALNRLKNVTMILNEVLRLYPPVITTTRRLFNGEAKIGNLVIPSGVGITLLTIQANRDPKVWGEDAHEFRPDRFAEGLLKATNGNVAYFPFGWGPRICIGQSFALTEAKMAIAMILQRFIFELSPTYTHAPCGLITLNAQYGAHLILRRR